MSSDSLAKPLTTLNDLQDLIKYLQDMSTLRDYHNSWIPYVFRDEDPEAPEEQAAHGYDLCIEDMKRYITQKHYLL